MTDNNTQSVDDQLNETRELVAELQDALSHFGPKIRAAAVYTLLHDDQKLRMGVDAITVQHLYTVLEKEAAKHDDCDHAECRAAREQAQRGMS